MAINYVKARSKQRIGMVAEWTATNPVLLNGELGIESDTNYMKRGDGSTAWNDLDYIQCPSDVTCSVQSTAGSSIWIEVPWEHVHITSSTPTGTEINVIEIIS